MVYLKSKPTPRGAPLPVDLKVRLAQAVLAGSERAVAEAAGMSRQSLARALAGLPIYRGTAALVERFLDGIGHDRTRVGHR